MVVLLGRTAVPLIFGYQQRENKFVSVKDRIFCKIIQHDSKSTPKERLLKGKVASNKIFKQ